MLCLMIKIRQIILKDPKTFLKKVDIWSNLKVYTKRHQEQLKISKNDQKSDVFHLENHYSLTFDWLIDLFMTKKLITLWQNTHFKIIPEVQISFF